MPTKNELKALLKKYPTTQAASMLADLMMLIRQEADQKKILHDLQKQIALLKTAITSP